MLAFPKPSKPWRSAAHLKHVRALSCAGCGRPGPSEAHHVAPHPMGRKCSDALACALCYECHRGPHGWHQKGRVGGLATREESMARMWSGCVAALGGTRLAHNVSAEDVARRLAAERESR